MNYDHYLTQISFMDNLRAKERQERLKRIKTALMLLSALAAGYLIAIATH